MRHALILAGGSGTRLWPLSRESRPKQLIALAGGKSLLEEAYDRLEGLIPPERRFVCAASRHRDAVLSAIPELAHTPAAEGAPLRYIGEPMGRDTLPAIALSCALIAAEDPEAIVVVLTSDHVIRPAADFRSLLDRAFSLIEASPGLLVTFGVEPTRPATVFGYLELGDFLLRTAGATESSGADKATRAFGAGTATGGVATDSSVDATTARHVLRFREKPDLPTATAFLQAGASRYLWNSGMFVWRASRFLELAGRYEPALTGAITTLASAAGQADWDARLTAAYPALKKISVDFGIMEKASADPDVTIAALPLAIQWKDIGSWTAYGELGEPDGEGNIAIGTDAAFVDSSGNLAVSSVEGHTIACLGCEDLVIVHTADATLVCPRSRAEDLKKLHGVIASREGGRLV